MTLWNRWERLAWIGEAIAHGQDPLVYPLNFFPEGWHIASHSTGYFLYLALAPVARVAGSAFAFNLFSVLGCVLAFAGALLLARRFLPRFPATVVALAFAFCGVRWQQPLTGGLHMFLGSAFLPWMLWSVERARASSRNGAGSWQPRRLRGWRRRLFSGRWPSFALSTSSTSAGSCCSCGS